MRKHNDIYVKFGNSTEGWITSLNVNTIPFDKIDNYVSGPQKQLTVKILKGMSKKKF